jgi:ligand-binding sensor domain-containing protein
MPLYLLLASFLFLMSCSSPTITDHGGEINVGNQQQLPFVSGVRAILEDSNGNFWFGSNQEGVAKFDGEHFTIFTVEDGLDSNQVRRIQEDRRGRVWFETGLGLSSSDGERINTYADKDYSSKHAWKKSEDDLWFKADASVGITELEGQPGTYRYDGEKIIFHVFPIPDFTWEWNPQETDGGSYYSITTPAFEGKDGVVWFGTYGAVIGYDGQAFSFLDNDSLGRDEENGFLHIRSIFVDSNKNLWIGNNGIGVFLHDGETTVHFSENIEVIEGSEKPSLQRVFAIGEDRAGHIWFGTVGSGAWRYDGKSFSNFTEKDGLPSMHIWSFYEDRRGDFWVAGENPSGAYKFNGKSFDRIY